ncbi:MAG: hypothetical protein EBZ47_05920, partial [Chlamydiae bacterium]|nr:hypothetical protein [Chlamydiota bacterium]
MTLSPLEHNLSPLEHTMVHHMIRSATRAVLDGQEKFRILPKEPDLNTAAGRLCVLAKSITGIVKYTFVLTASTLDAVYLPAQFLTDRACRVLFPKSSKGGLEKDQKQFDCPRISLKTSRGIIPTAYFAAIKILNPQMKISRNIDEDEHCHDSRRLDRLS